MPAQPRFSRQGTNSYSISTLGMVTSFKKSMSTGPGRPLAATAKAWRMTAGMVAASRTRKVAFVMGMAMPVMSTSWKASLPSVASVTLQVRKTTGEESRYAVAMPVVRLVAPGPEVAKHTPTFPVDRA